MNILSSWQQQNDRMRRSLSRLVDVATGVKAASSEHATDLLIHFFQDAFHLKDWIKRDIPAKAVDAEKAIKDIPTLRLCADIANGAKHFRLGPAKRYPPKTGDVNTAIVGQGATVRPAPVGSGRPAAPPLHNWSIESNGKTYDGLDLANQVVQEWDGWLSSQGLP